MGKTPQIGNLDFPWSIFLFPSLASVILSTMRFTFSLLFLQLLFVVHEVYNSACTRKGFHSHRRNFYSFYMRHIYFTQFRTGAQGQKNNIQAKYYWDFLEDFPPSVSCVATTCDKGKSSVFLPVCTTKMGWGIVDEKDSFCGFFLLRFFRCFCSRNQVMWSLAFSSSVPAEKCKSSQHLYHKVLQTRLK